MKKFLLLIFFFLYSFNSTAHMAHYNKYNKIEMEILKDGEVIGGASWRGAGGRSPNTLAEAISYLVRTKIA